MSLPDDVEDLRILRRDLFVSHATTDDRMFRHRIEKSIRKITRKLYDLTDDPIYRK